MPRNKKKRGKATATDAAAPSCVWVAYYIDHSKPRHSQVEGVYTTRKVAVRDLGYDPDEEDDNEYPKCMFLQKWKVQQPEPEPKS